MVLVLATLLAASPVSPAGHPSGLRACLDVGGLVGASWYVPAGRQRLEAAWAHMRGALFDAAPLEAMTLAYALPVMGPFLAAGQADAWADQAMLATCGVLQAIGLTVAATRWFGAGPGPEAEGPVLSVSPIAAGRLGLSLRLTGL